MSLIYKLSKIYNFTIFYCLIEKFTLIGKLIDKKEISRNKCNKLVKGIDGYYKDSPKSEEINNFKVSQ